MKRVKELKRRITRRQAAVVKGIYLAVLAVIYFTVSSITAEDAVLKLDTTAGTAAGNAARGIAVGILVLLGFRIVDRRTEEVPEKSTMLTGTEAVRVVGVTVLIAIVLMILSSFYPVAYLRNLIGSLPVKNLLSCIDGGIIAGFAVWYASRLRKRKGKTPADEGCRRDCHSKD